MKVIDNIDVLKSELEKRRRVALVPTMGNIHEGHLSLVRQAKKYVDTVVCTVFVNKLQFNERADFLNYPRTIDDDLKKLDPKVPCTLVDSLSPKAVASEINKLSMKIN